MKPYYQSAFSYNITRPYPYRWFTWVTFIGGIIALVLFSLINFAVNGYYLQTYYTANPNSTTSEAIPWWFNKAPVSCFTQLSTSCQPQQLTIGNSYFTTNKGMSYTVQAINKLNGAGIDVKLMSSLSYMNTTLLDCEVNKIELTVQGNGFPHIEAPGYSSWTNMQATATTSCRIIGTEFQANVAFLTRLSTMSNGLQNTPCLKISNPQVQPSLSYGCESLAHFFYQAQTAEARSIYDHDVSVNESYHRPWVRGYIPLKRNGTSDISSMDFFNCRGWFFVHPDGTLSSNKKYYERPQTLSDWNRTQTEPRISVVVDTFAKLFYSTLLTDLGQPNNSNALANVDLLQVFEANPPISEVRVEPATFFMEYACTLPVRKDVGSLIVTILIADLVFLQALWHVFNYCTVWWLCAKHPESNQCASCEKKDDVSCKVDEPPNVQSKIPKVSVEVSPIPRAVGSRWLFSTSRKPRPHIVQC